MPYVALFFLYCSADPLDLHSFPTRRSSDLSFTQKLWIRRYLESNPGVASIDRKRAFQLRSEEHTSELQSHSDLVCRLLLEKKNRSRTSARSRRSKNSRTRTAGSAMRSLSKF